MTKPSNQSMNANRVRRVANVAGSMLLSARQRRPAAFTSRSTSTASSNWPAAISSQRSAHAMIMSR
jgi:hypothetical protein